VAALRVFRRNGAARGVFLQSEKSALQAVEPTKSRV
jgi:hypothetical protein